MKKCIFQEINSYTQDNDEHVDLSPVLSPKTPQSSTASSCNKRTLKSTSWAKKKHQFLDASLKVLQGDTTQQHVTEPQELTFGKNIGQQLQEIEPRQKIIAQKLISDVLFNAKLGNLTDFSLIFLSSQPTPYQIAPYVPQTQLFQQPHPNVSTSTLPTYHEPLSYTRKPEVLTNQTFTTLTPLNQTSVNKDGLAEYLQFSK